MSTNDELTPAVPEPHEPEESPTSVEVEEAQTSVEVDETPIVGGPPEQPPEGSTFVDPDATPSTGFPSPIPAPRRSRRKLWLSLLAVVVAVVLLAVGYSGVRLLIDNTTYDDGHAAYTRADCPAAVPQYDNVISAWRIVSLGDTVNRATAEKQECAAFQSATAKPDESIIAALSAFVSDRPRSPLTDAARNRATDLFNRPDLTKVANPASCDIIDKLRSQQLIPPAVTPPFLVACGRAYVAAGNNTKALTTYRILFHDFPKDKAATDAETQMRTDSRWCLDLGAFRNEPDLSSRPDLLPGLLVTCVAQPTITDDKAVDLTDEFLKKYRGHRFTTDMLTAIAKRLNISTRADPNAKDGASAEVENTVGGDKAVLDFHNDAPDILVIVLSGPEPVFETIDPCQTCTVDKDNQPRDCSANAVAKSVVVPPGDYDVALVFRQRVAFPGPGIYSHWSLAAGKQYFSCIGEVKNQ